MTFWIAQFFGLLGLLVMIVGLFAHEKQKMLRYVVLNGMFFSVEYLLLGAFSGMGSNLFGIARTVMCMRKESDSRFDKKWLLALIAGVYALIGVGSYAGPISVLPILAEEIYVLSMWQSKVSVIRTGTAVMVVLWFIYDVVVAAYPSAVCDGIVFISTLASIAVNRRPAAAHEMG